MSGVLLLCAIPVETEALAELVEDAREMPLDQTYCIKGTIGLSSGRRDISVVEVGVGNTEAALNTITAVSSTEPDLVVFVGVAGGVKDVALGDVVVATKVHHYESGKDHASGFRPRPNSPSLPFRIEQIAKSIARAKTDSFRTFPGPIAAGEKVVASSDSITAALIRESFGDALAVEMEAAGFVSAMRRFHGTNFAVVRGISDLLDGKTNADGEGWQGRAVLNAATVARRLLEEYFRSEGPRLPESKTVELSEKQVAQAFPTPTPSHSYLLVAPTNSRLAPTIIASGLPLLAVLDLDFETDTNGLLAQTRGQLEKVRLVRLTTLADVARPSRSSVMWLAVNGLSDRHQPVDRREWVRKWRRRFRTAVAEMATVNGGRHVTVMVPLDDEADIPWLRTLTDDLVTEFGEDCTVVALTDAHGEVPDVGQEDTLRATAEELRAALTAVIGPTSTVGPRVLPAKDGSFVVAAEDLAWLQEEMQLWTLEEEASDDAEDVARLDFLRGGEIGRPALASGVDVLRDIYPGLQKIVRGVLANRRTLRLNLFHEPGAGGSTVGRRCLYDFHTQYPAVTISSWSQYETARRIDWLARSTDLPVLCLIDGPEVSDRMIAALLNDLQASQTPAVMLHVARRFSPPSELSNSAFLKARLSDEEASDFFDRYQSEMPGAYGELVQARDCKDDRRNAFYFGLSAFEAEFRGIPTYVRHRLQGLNEEQRQIALFCALSHYYGQHGLPEHSLARLIGLPVTRVSAIASLLAPAVRGLLWRSADGNWRTVHQFVAQEIMSQLGGGNDWKQDLTAWGQEFAEFCRGEGPVSDEMLEIAQAVFFERGGQELLGTEVGGRGRGLFSRLVEDVPSEEGAVHLMSQVAELFETQAHFFAHVARFYAFRLRNYERAVENAEFARTLNPEDSTLLHVVGMMHRARVYDAIGARSPLDQISEWGQRASEAFERSRELAPVGNEYAYISDAQMRIRIIDYAIRPGTIAAYIRGNPDPYVIDCIAGAEDLLARVRGQRDARDASSYEERSRGDLTVLYGDYDDALQMFDGLLSRPGADQLPIRRQIVWTHLARNDRRWDRLAPKATARVVALLEENLRQGKYLPVDIRQWWRAVRYLATPPSQDRVFEVMAYWRENERSIESLYSSYVSYATDVLDGIGTALPSMQKFLGECSARARGSAHRTWSFDWVGQGQGIAMLVHQSELGGWDRAQEFWRDSSKLKRVSGRVSNIRGPQAGIVDVMGIEAFFVPSRSSVEQGRDENARVSGFLGFSQDGPRLWEVRIDS